MCALASASTSHLNGETETVVSLSTKKTTCPSAKRAVFFPHCRRLMMANNKTKNNEFYHK